MSPGEHVVELRHLRYFVALSEHLNFTRAAAACHITQSTLSHQIKQLEDFVGRRLFDRADKRVRLTHAGRALLSSAVRALNEIDQGIRSAREMKTMMAGELRVGAGVLAFNIAIMPACIGRFIEDYPSVQISAEEIETSVIRDRLLSREIDIGIGDSLPDCIDVEFSPLYREELVFAVARSHVFARRKRIRAVELHRQKVAVTARSMSTRPIVDRCLDEAGASPVLVAELTSVDALMQLAKTPQVGAIVSRNSVKYVPELIAVGIDGPTPYRTVGFLRVPQTDPSPLVRAFVDIVRAEVARAAVLPGWPWVEPSAR